MYFPFPDKKWDKQDWDQIKNITKEKLISLLKKDDRWEFRGARDAKYVFYNPKLKPPFEYLAIHYHPHESFREKSLLKRILNHWCCTREDLKDWGAIH